MIKNQIQQILQQALSSVFSSEQSEVPGTLNYTIEHPRDKSHGDFSTNIAMLYAKFLKMAPRALAERIIVELPVLNGIKKVEIAGPGFINFYLADDLLQQQLESMWQSDKLGVSLVNNPEVIVVDYSSPNLAKEMHVGHLRSTIIGDAIANVLELKGFQVIRQNHVGDWGTQFGMLLAHFDDEQKIHPDSVQLNDLETFYKAAKKRFDEDSKFSERARQWVVLLQSGDAHSLKMWHTFIHLSLSHCYEIYKRLGVQLKREDVRAESAYNDDLSKVVERLQHKGLLVEHDGAQCVFMSEFKGKHDEPLPVIVQKKDGGFLYASTDLAAICYRHDVLHAHRVLYVVDARQSLHFQQVFALSYLAGFADENMSLEHIGFGMVLDKSGRPYKSRDGGVTKLADLLDEAQKRAKLLIMTKSTGDLSDDEIEYMASVIGVSSVKYADLSKNRNSDYIFDWDSMISFDGNTAPYLMYAYTRINSIFTKSKMTFSQLNQKIDLMLEQEIDLAKHLVKFNEVIDAVAQKATPHLLCSYLYDLAVLFSSFYENCPVLNQEDEAIKMSRLKLSALTAKILKQGLQVLGIPVLNRM
jgi:arginyl-tRNA synthetase